MTTSELSSFRWLQFFVDSRDSASACDWLRLSRPNVDVIDFQLSYRPYVQNAVNIEVTVFSRGVPLNQVLFTSCIDIGLSCLQVGTCCLCVTICIQVHVVICLQVGTCYHLFTRVYNILQGHVSPQKPRSEMTWRSAKRSAKSGSKMILHTTRGS